MNAETGRVTLSGVELFAEPSGLLWWPNAATMIVADLHLEKGSAYARRGVMLPPYDTRTTLARLATALRPEVRQVICLGDSFHDAEGPDGLAADDALALRRLTDAYDWLWVTGNHDPVLPDAIGGRVISGDVALDGLTLRHQAGDDPQGEISGHYHPKAHVNALGRRLSGACFVHDERRLILPAFGAYTGGLHVESEAIRALFPALYRVDILLRGRLMRREFVPAS